MPTVESVELTGSRGMSGMMSSSADNAAAFAGGDPQARAHIVLALECKICCVGVRAILEPDFDVSDANGDEEALVKVARRVQPDVIVMDFSFLKLNGIAIVDSIKKEQPNVKVVIVNSPEDLNQTGEVPEAGVSGYVLSSSEPSELLSAIREALQGRIYVMPVAQKRNMEDYRSRARRGLHSDTPLTPRQVEVLQCLAEGRTAREIGELLYISARTVEFHKYNMMEKLGLERSTELIQYALEHGIAQPDEAGPIPPRNK